ncbi:ATP-binding protein [Halobellus clavatus]|jgi:signal transduction histidine kinase|uniref:histidine kinase n=1 Tax=Halobellus clavatus TaxID=660517 RepID=A0A1H3F299_9EURY|nr:ATP-binding protein [Halobellus clavatus]SDX85136.1 His Kinase A (phospho-acceptor) domain-containing protein [Halobellus clavatus]
MLPSLPSPVLFALYVLAFASAAVVSFGMLPRARRIEHEDTRRGLSWLLLTSGGWAAAHVGYLTLPTPTLQYVLYEVGLIIGLASVGPWLYFCSAYTGRTFHRNTTIQRSFAAVFLLLVAIKVTNPLHQWYFVAEPALVPFRYLQVTHRPLHWIVMGLSYALTAIGFFMLFELFVRVNSNAEPLFVLLGLTGLPVIFDVAGAVYPNVLDLTYSSIGVAAFALGVFVLYFDRFQFVRVAGDGDNPVVVVDESGRIRDFNARAEALFDDLSGSINEAVSEVAPELVRALDAPDPVFETDVSGTTRYYNVSDTPFTTGGAQTGQSIVLTDVTDREQYRRELEEKNEKLEEFASIVSHDLRNPLQVAKGRTELAIAEEDVEHLTPVKRAHERMEQLIDEILTLAREGVSIDDVERVDLPVIAERSWSMVPATDPELELEGEFDADLSADPERLQQLFENLFRNAVEHGGSDVTITVGALPDGFYVEDDGDGFPEGAASEVFDAGFTTAADGTGFGLAIVSEIVEAHDWSIEATEGTNGGARFEIHTDTD